MKENSLNNRIHIRLKTGAASYNHASVINTS